MDQRAIEGQKRELFPAAVIAASFLIPADDGTFELHASGPEALDIALSALMSGDADPRPELVSLVRLAIHLAEDKRSPKGALKATQFQDPGRDLRVLSGSTNREPITSPGVHPIGDRIVKQIVRGQKGAEPFTISA